MDDLAEIASRWGVDLGYVDAAGRHQSVDSDAARRILALLQSSCERHEGLTSRKGAGERAFQGEEGRRWWLLAVQLYGVRSASNWGHGDFGDLAQLIRLAADIGATGIGLNPLHALFPDRPEQASPYSPNSRLFLNPLYIDVAAAPGFPGIEALNFADEIEWLRAPPLVDYAGVGRLKMRALREAYHRFCQNPDRDLAAFRDERGASLQRFAAFETLRARYPVAWWDWPDEWRRPSGNTVSRVRQSDAEEFGFHEYVQWVAERQLQSCQQLARQRGLSIGLYADLAVGVDPGGADGWAQQDVLLRELSIGAPPDILNKAGQDWGLTTYNPHCLLASDFAPFRELLSATMRHAGAIRLDHILGLNRVFAIPRGMSARQGAYLRFPLHGMLDVVTQESQRHRCIVIGEDLGTVPEGFREMLYERGIWTYLVMLFERDHDGAFRAPERYPANALATFATHDLATYSGWASGHDLRAKRAIGMDPGETDAEREQACAALHHALAHYRRDDGDFAAVARCLAQTPSRLVAVNVEDIWGVLDQTNIPGTVEERPNWRHRLPVTIEQMRTDRRLHVVAEAFARAGRSQT